MKIMLAACNAKYIHSNLAVYDLKAYAQKYASNVILKEYTINQQKEDILGNIGSLSAISEENAANNQQVNANIEEILTQIQTVGANCDKMKQISGELENSVAYFHTEKEPDGK